MSKEEIEILKSPVDKNQYKYVKLENQVEVILISDSSTDHASCSLAVGVGSLSNPKEIEGLAHFLEHMLFLGTEKYPNEKEFIEFIARNNGSYNATTAANKTTYFYQVPQDQLKESLDRFSSFFISPLMSEDAVDRELNAVDSEHNNNKQNDVWRSDRIINDQFEGHPTSNFATGNKSTLKIDGIRDKVVEFYNQYYSGNIMKVAIYGRESLEELEALAREFFSPIKNKNVTIEEFDPLTLKQSIWLECESKDAEYLKLVFPVTDDSIKFRDYKDQSATVFSHVLGHESTGSLLALLQEKDYATSLSFGASSTTYTMNKMEFSIYLTPLGKEHLDEIIGLTLQYAETVQCPKYCYDEKKLISNVNWEHFQKSDPLSVTTTISHHLLKVESPTDVIKYNHFWSEYSPETIEKIRSHIRPDNMIAMLYSKEIKGGTSLVEKHYGIKYNKRFINQDDIKRWRAIEKSDKLHVPPENPYIPKDFRIKAPQDQSICIPETVYNENGILINHSLDHRFNTPKARVYFKLISPHFGSVQNVVYSLFMKKSLKTVLNEKILYYLGVLQCEVKLNSYMTHLQLESYGYSDTILNALLEVFRFFYSFDLTDKQFEKIKLNVEKRQKKALYYSPYTISPGILNMFTLNTNGPILEKIEITKALTKDALIAYVRSYFSYLNLSVLIVGNVTKEEAQSFGKALNQFKRIKLASTDTVQLRRVRLPQGVDTQLRQRLYDTQQTNCCSTRLVLLGEEFTLKLKCILLFLKQILHNSYFDELRTKQQFGYVVNVTGDPYGNIQGLRFTVQSHTRTPEEICAVTDEFLYAFADALDQFEQDPQSFRFYVESIQKSLTTKYYNNRSQASIYWNSYVDSETFDYDSIVSNALNSLTIQDVKQAFNDYVLPSSPKRRVFIVNLYPSSMNLETTSDKENIKILLDASPTKFKSTCGYFPNNINLN